MSNAAKDTSANDDVLASIRRLVAEESSRGQSAPAPHAPEITQTEPEPKPQPDPPRQGRVLQRRRAPESGTVVDRQSINRAARAKLLLTDDFRVEDVERWTDEADAPDLPPEPELDAEPELEPELDPDFEPAPAPALEAEADPVVHGRRVYDDDDQAQISREIESFLSASEPKVEVEPVAETVAEDAEESDTAVREMSFEDIPDAVLSASQDRAARRREASARATSETSRASAALRAPVTDVEEVAKETPTTVVETDAAPAPEPVPELAVSVEPAAVPAPQAGVPAATVDQIEAAVKASLAAFAEQGDLASPAESELVLDEEMLREMVSDIVRRELQGSLGERITRNVRKLVRREIYRALETRDLG